MDNLIIYNTDDGQSHVSLLVSDGEAWLTQNQLAELFATSVQNISEHINNILSDKELDENSVIKYFLITAQDGKQYQVKHYALDMILAVGFRVRSPRGVQFRRWANTQLRAYLDKGFVLDKERLKNPQGRFDHFDELLAEIREIRAGEARFYQKVRDLFAHLGRVCFQLLSGFFVRKWQMQGEKRSKVGHLTSISNAADAVFWQKSRQNVGN